MREIKRHVPGGVEPQVRVFAHDDESSTAPFINHDRYGRPGFYTIEIPNYLTPEKGNDLEGYWAEGVTFHHHQDGTERIPDEALLAILLDRFECLEKRGGVGSYEAAVAAMHLDSAMTWMFSRRHEIDDKALSDAAGRCLECNRPLEKTDGK